MNRYMEAARKEVAQCWCDETKLTERDLVLAARFAKQLANCMDTADRILRTADFYRKLLDQCAKHLGSEAYTAEDEPVRETPIYPKIPELVAELVRRKNNELHG